MPMLVRLVKRGDAYVPERFVRASDLDGTLNKLGDFDEEWNIQLAIPLRSLEASASAGTRLEFALNRCEIAFDGQRSCGAWGSNESPAELVLQP